jgi:hypothetical protein
MTKKDFEQPPTKLVAAAAREPGPVVLPNGNLKALGLAYSR